MGGKMDPSEILKMLNEFYSNAFSQLITLAIAIFGLGGVILPLILNYSQNRSLKNERDSLLTQLKESMRQMKVELKEEIQKKFDDEKKEIKQLTLEEVENAKGIAFFQQAKSCTESNNFVAAAMSYCWTIKALLVSKDELNVGRSIRNLTSDALPNLYKEDYEENDELSEEIDNLIIKMEEFNLNGKYSDEINDIKKLVKKGRSKLKTKK
jgi:hypothetical protein